MGYTSNEDDMNFYNEEELNVGEVQEDMEPQEVQRVEESSEPLKDGVSDSNIDGDGNEEEPEARSYSMSAEGFGASEDSDEEVAQGSPKEYSLSGTLEFEDDDEDETYSSEEKLRMYADTVISAMLGEKSIRNYALSRVLTVASPRLFRDENYVIFSVLFKFRDRVKTININTEFIRLFLQRNKDIISKARGYIDIHAYEEIEGSLELGYISGVLKHFKRLSLMEDMSETEFNTAFETYLFLFKNEELIKVLQTGQVIANEGVKIGSRYYSGFDDSKLYTRREIAAIEGLVDQNKGSGYTSMSDIILGNRGEEKKPIKVGDFGKLKKLNEYYGGIYSGRFYQIMAPAKSGKSKFCARLNHICQVIYGVNVSVWAKEGGDDAWTAQMRAIHFDYTYNQGVSITERKFGVDQDTIQTGSFKDDATRDLEMSSAMDLASNPDYGKVDFIDQPFNVETFIDSIDASVKANGSQVVIIDYLQLIMSENTSMSERERIATAYPMLLDYCRTNNVAVITPAQYKQSVIDGLMSTKDTSSAEMRTAGGNSAEVIRTPDISIALWASTADLANNRLKILSIPSRFAKPFPEIPCIIDLGCCQFIDEE